MLLIVFGAVLAACMPLVLSIISIVLALALTALIGQVYPMNTFVLNILTMMGLAVGIDYTLFVISRYREERARGLAKIDAIAATGATANRAIFFSGMTVVLAMIGMVIVPIDIMISMGMGVMLVVFTTLLTALIALPAVLSLLGDRVNALRVPFLGRAAARRANGHGGVWERLAHSIMRRPVIWLTRRRRGAAGRRRPGLHDEERQPHRRAPATCPTATTPSRAGTSSTATSPSARPTRCRSWSTAGRARRAVQQSIGRLAGGDEGATAASRPSRPPPTRPAT